MALITSTHYECDRCDNDVSGTTKQQLREDGWKFYPAGTGRWFLMCDTCRIELEKRWAFMKEFAS